MPSDALRVDAVHLRELADKHGQAATEMNAAADLVAGLHRRISISHGVIATPTARAIGIVEQARRTAGSGLSAASRGLDADLNSAARGYSATDSASGTRIDGFRR